MDQPRYFQPQIQSGVIWIQGEAGAKAYPVSPGNSVPLFDSESERFFIKSVDISGMPQPLREFTYKEVRPVVKTEQAISNYATKEDLDDFQNAVLTKVDEMMQKYLSNKKTLNKDKGD